MEQLREKEISCVVAGYFLVLEFSSKTLKESKFWKWNSDWLRKWKLCVAIVDFQSNDYIAFLRIF